MTNRFAQLALGLLALAVFLPLGLAQAPAGAVLAVGAGAAVVVGATVFLVYRGTRR
jgi:hypothetical protein